MGLGRGRMEGGKVGVSAMEESWSAWLEAFGGFVC